MEKRDLYDKDKKLTGEFIYKGDIVPKGRYYLTIAVWIENSKGEILLQLTSPQKKHKWSATGGHPKMGESSLQGITTEISEELGINVNPLFLKLFKTIKTEDDFVDLYYLKQDIDINTIKVQEEEVEKVKWADKIEIEKMIEDGIFLKEHIEFYRHYLSFLESSGKKNGIIFDLDGTLWDSTEQVAKTWNKILPKDKQLSVSEIKSFMGKTNEEIANLLFPNTSIENKLDILEKCTQEEMIFLKKNGGTLYEDLEKTLKTLSFKYNFFIVSNCQAGYIEIFLEKHNLKNYFTDFESNGNTKLSKSENISLIIKRNRIAKAMYVGDTQGDCNATKQNNIPFIFASYGFGVCKGYDYKINNFIDIIQLVDKFDDKII